MKYRLLYNKITVVALSAVLSLSAVSCGKLDTSKLDGNALTVIETESKAEVKKTEDSSSKKVFLTVLICSSIRSGIASSLVFISFLRLAAIFLYSSVEIPAPSDLPQNRSCPAQK